MREVKTVAVSNADKAIVIQANHWYAGYRLSGFLPTLKSSSHTIVETRGKRNREVHVAIINHPRNTVALERQSTESMILNAIMGPSQIQASENVGGGDTVGADLIGGNAYLPGQSRHGANIYSGMVISQLSHSDNGTCFALWEGYFSPPWLLLVFVILMIISVNVCTELHYLP